MTDAGLPVPGPADYAYACVRRYAGGLQAPDPPSDAFYDRRAACFVTLKKRGELRGCIGTLEPAEVSLGHEIRRNAYSSALRDPRFPPVGEDEVEALSCSVDVLDASEPCGIEDLDPEVYGIIVASGFHRGVLLPALEGIDTVEQQVSIALQKAGVTRDQGFEVRRFRVTRYRRGELRNGAESPAAPSGD